MFEGPAFLEKKYQTFSLYAN